MDVEGPSCVGQIKRFVLEKSMSSQFQVNVMSMSSQCQVYVKPM